MSVSLFRPFDDFDDDFWPFSLIDTNSAGGNRGGRRRGGGQQGNDGSTSSALQGFMPRVNLQEKEGEAHLTAELPGIKREDVNITLERGLLTISGQMKQEESKEEGKWRIKERRSGHFERSIRVNPALKEEEVKAKFDNGILEVTYPLQAAESPAKRITIS